MRKWLQTRGRSLLSLLSDLGGALAFVVLATGLIVAAIAGAVLLALDAFPQPFLAMLILGAGLLAAGIALHLLRAPMIPAPVPVRQAPQADNPNERAAVLESRHHQRVLAERRALRWVREELLDNRHRIDRAGEGEEGELQQLTDEHWQECEAALLELENPEPHAKAREAFRQIKSVAKAQTLIPSDVQAATEAIDEAVTALSDS